MSPTARRPPFQSLHSAGTAVAATLVLTSAHHLYGARLFDTPWRAHVAHLAAWAGVAFALCLLVARLRPHRTSGRLAMGAFFVLAVGICVLWLGLYEGGYNHLIKNLAWAAHVPASAFHTLFPPAVYEPPGNWLFETSGVLQLPLGLLAGRWARQAYLASRNQL